MYEIYTTPALVLSTVTQGDSDLYVRFYTRDLGFVGAIATSARKETSKNRYSLQPHSLVSLSLVKGKRSFRVTGAEHDTHLFMGKDVDTKNAVGKISTLLLLLIHGQEKDVELYDLLDTLLRNLAGYGPSEGPQDQNTGPRRARIEAYEIYVVVRVLHQLGYFDQGFTDPVPETLFQDILPTDADLEHISSRKLTYIEYINKCIHNTQF